MSSGNAVRQQRYRDKRKSSQSMELLMNEALIGDDRCCQEIEIHSKLGRSKMGTFCALPGARDKTAKRQHKRTKAIMPVVAAAAAAPSASSVEAKRSHEKVSKPNPVKIDDDQPDIFQMDRDTHTYARVRFSRGQPVVDIRRYKPDVTRPQFYYPNYIGSIALPHSVFKSLIENKAKISELLEQYD
jgi:hypothetical protein